MVQQAPSRRHQESSRASGCARASRDTPGPKGLPPKLGLHAEKLGGVDEDSLREGRVNRFR